MSGWSSSPARAGQPRRAWPCVIGLVAIAGSAPAAEQSLPIPIDCRAERVIELTVSPAQARVLVSVPDCHCSSDPDMLKAFLRNRAEHELTTEPDHVLFPVGLVPYAAELILAPGETRELEIYCYTPEQERSYLESVRRSASDGQGDGAR